MADDIDTGVASFETRAPRHVAADLQAFGVPAGREGETAVAVARQSFRRVRGIA